MTTERKVWRTTVGFSVEVWEEPEGVAHLTIQMLGDVETGDLGPVEALTEIISASDAALAESRRITG